MEFHLVHNRKENCHHDHILFNVKGNGNIVFSVHIAGKNSAAETTCFGDALRSWEIDTLQQVFWRGYRAILVKIPVGRFQFTRIPITHLNHICNSKCVQSNINGTLLQFVGILVNWHVSAGILTSIPRYPRQNTLWKVSIYQDPNDSLECVVYVAEFFSVDQMANYLTSLERNHGGIVR